MERKKKKYRDGNEEEPEEKMVHGQAQIWIQLKERPKILTLLLILWCAYNHESCMTAF